MNTVHPRWAPRRTRAAALLCLGLALGACTDAAAPARPGADLGDFRLGHNVVVAPNLVMGPFSREASAEEWIAAMTTAIDERLGAYQGERLFHLGISIDGYVLALPGVPVVAAPRSLLIVQVTVWDDAAARKLTAEPKRFTVFEGISGDTVVGSGLTRTKSEQMRTLSGNAAAQIEAWLAAQNKASGWFAPAAPAEPDTPPAADAPRDPPAEE